MVKGCVSGWYLGSCILHETPYGFFSSICREIINQVGHVQKKGEKMGTARISNILPRLNRFWTFLLARIRPRLPNNSNHPLIFLVNLLKGSRTRHKKPTKNQVIKFKKYNPNRGEDCGGEPEMMEEIVAVFSTEHLLCFITSNSATRSAFLQPDLGWCYSLQPDLVGTIYGLDVGAVVLGVVAGVGHDGGMQT